ncbi:hypothetical protein MANES_01G141701v8 [Manihot esculenta]|uniref:Uncharacterized protein n=1 Tax=Manihot esculenta TaxID=3983 RepID=A0A2C9WM62_MANES|nr:hypothetical protein MANES_01G141701v8 [Manihot esculenta]
MEVAQVLHMNEGEGETSYYKNSSHLKKVILTTKPILEECITKLCEEGFPKCLKMVEMGCSSGATALLPLQEIIEIIYSIACRLKQKPPILQVFLNDLPGNDFNTIFRSLIPKFHEKLEKEKGNKFGTCFIGAMAGSFYGRLFPPQSLHFVHSSYGLHWISQVPEGLVSEYGIPLNKYNICVAETSPPSCRSEEMASGGAMVLNVLAKSNKIPYCKYGSEICQLIGTVLNEMVQEGLIEEKLVASFNIPVYAPSAEEVRSIIERENSFVIARLEEFQLSWDANIEETDKEKVFDKWEKGEYVASYIRAATEPMLVAHFGHAIIPHLFRRYSIKSSDYLEKGMAFLNTLAISLQFKC